MKGLFSFHLNVIRRLEFVIKKDEEMVVMGHISACI